MEFASVKRRLSGDQLKRDTPQRVQVGAMVGVRITSRLLGGDVGWRAERRADLRDGIAGACAAARVADGLGDAEIGHYRRLARQQDVVGLDVAMHDAAFVRVDQRARHVAQHTHGLGFAHRASRQPCAQRFALHKRHREVRHAIGRASREHGHDVGLLQRRGELNLSGEALRAERGAQLRREHLDDDASAELVLGGDKHARHAATAKLALDGVVGAQQ